MMIPRREVNISLAPITTGILNSTLTNQRHFRCFTAELRHNIYADKQKLDMKELLTFNFTVIFRKKWVSGHWEKSLIAISLLLRTIDGWRDTARKWKLELEDLFTLAKSQAKTLSVLLSYVKGIAILNSLKWQMMRKTRKKSNSGRH
jgi:hypothetical protein